MTFLHTFLGKRRDINVNIDRGCYDICFMNDDCNPQNAALPCSRSSRHANVELSLTDTPHNILPINGISKRARWALIILCLIAIAAFVYTEGNKVPTHSMPGIGSLRFIASIYIVACHLQRFGRDYMTPVPFAVFLHLFYPGQPSTTKTKWKCIKLGIHF